MTTMRSPSTCPLDPANVRAYLDEFGFALCTDFPTLSPDSLIAFADSLGTKDLSIDPELSGPLIMSIRYDEIKAPNRERPAYFSHDAFPIHTDMSYVRNPPRLLFMLCVTPDAAGGGLTVLSDCQSAWEPLLARHRRELERPQFRFRHPPNTQEGEIGEVPISEPGPVRRMWRYRIDSMTVPSSATEAVESFSEGLEEGSFQFRLRAGDLIVVDNHRMLHGRTAFDPAASPTPRHLLRTYARERPLEGPH